MRSFFIFSLLFVSLSAFADEDCDNDPGKKLEAAVKKTAQDEPSCPASKKVKFLCMYIDSRTEDEEASSKYRYKYQRVISEAACITDKDDESVKRQKLQKMWATYESQLICNNLQFDVSNGNIIKYAATSMFDAFIYDVASWKVNLNKVDENDGKTVLDYIKQKIETKKGTSIAPKLEIYYKILRDAGAKHKSEL